MLQDFFSPDQLLWASTSPFLCTAPYHQEPQDIAWWFVLRLVVLAGATAYFASYAVTMHDIRTTGLQDCMFCWRQPVETKRHEIPSQTVTHESDNRPARVAGRQGCSRVCWKSQVLLLLLLCCLLPEPKLLNRSFTAHCFLRGCMPGAHELTMCPESQVGLLAEEEGTSVLRCPVSIGVGCGLSAKAGRGGCGDLAALLCE